jgi:hypothetical protein
MVKRTTCETKLTLNVPELFSSHPEIYFENHSKNRALMKPPAKEGK